MNQINGKAALAKKQNKIIAIQKNYDIINIEGV